MPVPSFWCKHTYLLLESRFTSFHTSLGGGRDCPVPAQQTAWPAISAPVLAWPRRNCHAAKATQPAYGLQQLGNERQEVESINNKLAKPLAQPTPRLYLLRGFNSVQTLEKKNNRKCFICYLINFLLEMNSSVPGEACGSDKFTPRGLTLSCYQWCVWAQAKHTPHFQFLRDFT